VVSALNNQIASPIIAKVKRFTFLKTKQEILSYKDLTPILSCRTNIMNYSLSSNVLGEPLQASKVSTSQ